MNKNKKWAESANHSLSFYIRVKFPVFLNKYCKNKIYMLKLNVRDFEKGLKFK